MSALDKKLRAELQLELRDLHRRLGATFINVTHDQEEAIIMSDRIAIMRDGKVMQLGAPKELYERPATRFVADFLGKSNFLHGNVAAIERGIATVDIGGGAIRHRVNGAALAPGMPVTLALRPHKAGLANGHMPEGMNALGCAVISAVYVGTYAQLLVRAPGGETLTLTLPTNIEHALPGEGTAATVIWPPDATVLVAED